MLRFERSLHSLVFPTSMFSSAVVNNNTNDIAREVHIKNWIMFTVDKMLLNTWKSS